MTSPPTQARPTTIGKNTDFEIVEERWNEIEADAGTAIVRARSIVMHILDLGAGKWSVNSTNIVSVITNDPRHRGPPTPSEAMAKLARFPVDFRPIAEPFNVYRTRGRTPVLLKTRLTTMGVSRVVDGYDGLGEPMYEVETSMSLSNPIDDKNRATK